jgi:UDP-glucose 4-epimerase
MKNILLLGGTGFIGKNIIEFYSNDFEVNLVVLARNYKSIDLEGINSERITVKIGFITDLDFIKNLIVDYQINAIIHLVSGLIPSSSMGTFYESMDDVVISTFKLIDYISDKDIKFVFFSSGGTIYGEAKEVIKESNNLNPINNYGFSKLIIENYIRFKSNTTSLNYIILRPSNVFGKYQRFEGNQGFISVAINKIYQEIPIEIWGDGNTVRDYIHINDVVVILKKLLDIDFSNESINLSSGIGYSLLDVLSIIEQKLNKRAILNFDVKRVIDADKVILDNSKLLGIVNHKFVDLNDGIENQVINYMSLLKNEK